MIRLWLLLIFCLLALGGLAMIFYGIRLKQRPAEDSGGNEPIVLGFSKLPEEEEPDILDFETGSRTIGRPRKKRFDPGRHSPETIESKYKRTEELP